MSYIQNYELPIMAIRQRGDSIYYTVSAVMSIYEINRRQPTAIGQFGGREVLLYTGGSSLKTTSPNCFNQLITKYSKILHIDKMNLRDGTKIGSERDMNYDPIRAEIVQFRGRYVMNRRAPEDAFSSF